MVKCTAASFILWWIGGSRGGAKGLITHPSLLATVCSENCKAQRPRVPFYGERERTPVTRRSLGLASCLAKYY